MRLFIAAILPEEAKLKVEDYINSLRSELGGVKWESPEKLHLTLKFLGNTDNITASKVADIVHDLSSDYSPFDMNVTRFGAFPDLQRPRILYLGLSQNQRLSSLKTEIDNSLHALGFEKENRKFLPHITLGRVKNRFNLRGPVPIPEKFSFVITQIGVIKSELTPKGSIYSSLNVFDLTD